MCIKYNEDMQKYIPIIMGASREQRSAFQKRKEPYIKASWERYVRKLNQQLKD